MTRHCHWFIMKCKHSRVVSLVLQAQSLKGFILFHEVNIPDLSYRQIHGKFNLSYNTLSSLIFEELGSFVVLVYLLLSNNMLSGKIPRSLSRLTNLTILDLSRNLLTSSTPLEFGNSLKLQGL